MATRWRESIPLSLYTPLDGRHVSHYKTALSRLQVYRPKAGNFCRCAGVQITRLPAYGRIILPSRCMHTRPATWELPGCIGRFSNCMGVHITDLLQRGGSFSNCIQVLCSGRIPNCMHAVAVALLQWQDTKLHARMAAVKDEQTCNNNNSNNKARCIPAELCKLSRVKSAVKPKLAGWVTHY
jgi:hypothetical protein